MKRTIDAILIFGIIMALLMSCAYAEEGNTPYMGASSWAVEELDKAAEYGFITDKIKDEMNAAITREELAELAVRLYEKHTGRQAAAQDMNVFSDVSNPEVYKAYSLDIVNGTNRFRRLFSPDELATREQVAVMLYRTVKAMEPDADLSASGADKFDDERDISGWAHEAVKFMNKNGFLKGVDGRINPRDTCTREMAVVITTRIYEKYFPETADPQENGETDYAGEDITDTVKQIVLNDIEIFQDDYSIKKKNDSYYIFIAAEKLGYAFKRQNAGNYTYPEVDINGSSVSISWKYEEGVMLQADFREGAEEAVINGKRVSIGMAPYSGNGKHFIPVNLFVAELDMAAKADIKDNILYIQYRKSFSPDVLTGTWSDTETDLFADHNDITGGAVSLPVFGTAYKYNSDGTYEMRMVSNGENNNIFLSQKGKYRVMGSTIMCYDIFETVYNGSPFTIKHENRALERPQYLFIHNYDPKEEKIEIGGFWLEKRQN